MHAVLNLIISRDKKLIGPINVMFTDAHVMKFNIFYLSSCLHVSKDHNSHNSNRNTSCLFEVMFPDSPIAKKFSCGSDKTSYLVNFGLAPFFSEELIHSLTDASCFSISYDESFNSETKNEQMDFCVRFWDSEKFKVVDRYLTSEFLGHPNAENLLDSFVKAT